MVVVVHAGNKGRCIERVGFGKSAPPLRETVVVTAAIGAVVRKKEANPVRVPCNRGCDQVIGLGRDAGVLLASTGRVLSPARAGQHRAGQHGCDGGDGLTPSIRVVHDENEVPTRVHLQSVRWLVEGW